MPGKGHMRLLWAPKHLWVSGHARNSQQRSLGPLSSPAGLSDIQYMQTKIARACQTSEKLS